MCVTFVRRLMRDSDAIITWTDGSHYGSKATIVSIHSVDAHG
jgi:hypothetical protein